jgi:hypothetical protein
MADVNVEGKGMMSVVWEDLIGVAAAINWADLKPASGERALGRSIPGSCTWRHHQIYLNLVGAPENRPRNTRTQSHITPPQKPLGSYFFGPPNHLNFPTARLRDVCKLNRRFSSFLSSGILAVFLPELLAATTDSA